MNIYFVQLVIQNVKSVLRKKEWIKNKLNDGHVFRKFDASGKIFIEYKTIEAVWVSY